MSNNDRSNLMGTAEIQGKSWFWLQMSLQIAVELKRPK